MLIRWISTGYLVDPFEEFMVKESGHITKGVLESDYTDEYWERRYTASLVEMYLPGNANDLRSSEMAHPSLRPQKYPPASPRPLYRLACQFLDLEQAVCQVALASLLSSSRGSIRYCWPGSTLM